MPAAGALANIEASSILSRYAKGDMISDIARDLGVHETSVYRDLIRDCPDEWIHHQAARSLAAYEQAMEDLDKLEHKLGPVACSLALGRVKSRQWELERLLKRLYGPQMALTGADGGPIQVQIVRFAGKLIEGEVVDKSVDKSVDKGW